MKPTEPGLRLPCLSRPPAAGGAAAALAFALLAALALASCARAAKSPPEAVTAPGPDTVEGRFPAPPGYGREALPGGSYGAYLRALPLKAAGSPVRYFDGTPRLDASAAAVLDLPILAEDLVQCADAAIKIRAEYLYSRRRYAEISFAITNGERVALADFAAGRRPRVEGTAVRWECGFHSGYGRGVFDEYLAFVYAWAGSWSLSRELLPLPGSAVEPGDMYVVGGFPGHVVVVVDVAVDKASGRKVMLLAQGYMPSQDIHVLKSPYGISPWYYEKDEALVTPDWVFARGSLMGFVGEGAVESARLGLGLGAPPAPPGGEGARGPGGIGRN